MSNQSEKPVYSKNFESVEHDYHKEKHTIRNIVIIGTVLAIAAASGGAYWWFFAKEPASKPVESTQTTAPQTSPKDSIAETTKNYTSKNFSLSFDYPEDWTIDDSQSSNTLTAASPVMNLVGADSQPITGQVILTFREPGQPLSEFEAGNAQAVRDSERITYARPSPGQRGATYISFASYAGAAVTTALDGIYITGDFGYQKLQAIPAIDVSKVNPIITVTFRQCDMDCQGTSTPVSVSNTMWDDQAFSDALKRMLESLVVE